MISTKEFHRLLKLANQINLLETDVERLNFCKFHAKDVKVQLGDYISRIVLNCDATETQLDLLDVTQTKQGNVFNVPFQNSGQTLLLFSLAGISAENL